MNEIQYPQPVGQVLDAVIFNPSLTAVWNGTGFEPITLDNWESYVIPMTNGFASIPVNLPDSILPYPIGIYLRTNPGAANPNDIRIGITDVRWPVVPEVVTQSSYSTVAEADAYFNQLVHTEFWLQSTADNKQRALNQATALIDQFAFVGFKTDRKQIHEWPRSRVLMEGTLIPCDVIPREILFAQFEIAKEFNDGFDLEREMRGLRVISRGYSSVRTTYDLKGVPLWLEYGVPSFRAWTYLLAYLDRDSNGRIIIHRVS